MAKRGRKPKDYLGNRAGSAQTGQVTTDNRWKYGQLHYLDNIPEGDPKLAVAISNYAHQIESNRQSRHWVRAVQWVENILFMAGRHYIDDILVSRLSRDSDGNTSTVKEINRFIPRPINDFLGRYVETNIALFTENRPRPRVTSKSDRREDQTAAELSEFTMEFLWEKLGNPELQREVARIILACGICWKEVVWDPTEPRLLKTPVTTTENQALAPGGVQPIQIPLTREVTKRDKSGFAEYEASVGYGDITSIVVSPFEMHLPVEHWWNGERMGWIMREYYTSIEQFQDRYGRAEMVKKLKPSDGWHLDRLEDIGSASIQNLPLWWWERLADLVEGPGPSLYVGTPEAWENHTVIRWLDRKPNPQWPKGRSMLIAGNQVIYDSPKDIGARAYDIRWPHRWHPYVRFRWEPLIGSIYGRSLVSKLLPKLKRVNAIDTTMIMWRRTVPIATWIVPKGCAESGTYVTSCTGEIREIQDIEEGCVQNKEGIGQVTRRFAYDNDEQIIELKAKGQFPLKMTHTHKIPVIPAEAMKRVKRKFIRNVSYKKDYSVISNSDIVEKSMGDIKKGDHVLTGFSRERSGLEKLEVWKYFRANHGKNKPITQIVKIDEEFLRLAGLYLAEGNIKTDRKNEPACVQFTIGCHEIDTIGKEIKDKIKSIFGLNVSGRVEYNPKGKAYQIRVHSKALAGMFLSLFGTGSTNKRIAPEIFTTPNSLLPLVGGWIEGDGCSQNIPQLPDGRKRTWKYSSASTTSLNLAFQIRSILLDEKIVTSICIPKKEAYRKNQRYILYWDTTARRQLAPYCNKFKEDTAQKTAQQGFWIENWYAVPVRSVKPIEYTGKVYDLEVTGDHHYHANGIIVHNSHPVDDIWSGRPGMIWEYDPRRTQLKAPEPVFPPPYPEAALREREQQISEMEAISGTEEILRGQRPTGVTNARMIEILRKQALASRSAILQAWDESQEEEGSILLQETMKHIRNDPEYAERIRLLAREKHSRLTIQNFSGTDLSDNVVVRVDTASMALVSKEAKEAKAIEFMQYAPGLMALPFAMRQAIVEELGFAKTMTPQGPDVERAKMMVQWIKQNQFERLIPFPEDDPYVFMETLSNELKADSFWDLSMEQQEQLLKLISTYKDAVKRMEEARQQMEIMQAQAAKGPPQQ